MGLFGKKDPPPQERVEMPTKFGMGFGFKPDLGGTRPALTGRKLISFTTSGAPDFWMRDTGALIRSSEPPLGMA